MNHIETADRLIAAYNAKDFGAMRSLVAEDLKFAHFNRGAALEKREDLMAILEQFAGGLIPDRQFEVPERVTALDDLIVRESYWTGTPSVDIPGLGEAGKPFRYKFCSVMRFGSDGRLVEWTDYG